jgi:hypothetical protein
MMMDFENSLRPALQQSMPQIQLVGCYFHFCQCIFRHIKDCGLQRAYNDRNNFLSGWLRKVMALAFLPVDEVLENQWQLHPMQFKI